MIKYKNSTVRITLRNFGHRTDGDLRTAVLEALVADLRDVGGPRSYEEDIENFLVEEVIG